MAGRERDPVDGGMQSPLADANGDTTSFTSNNHVSSSEKINPGHSSGHGNKEVLVQSTAGNAPEPSLHNSERSPQCDKTQTLRQIPDSKDKGKTPMRANSETLDRSVPDNGEVSERNTPQSQAHTTSPPSIAEKLGMSEPPDTLSTGDVNGETISGPSLEECHQYRSQLASLESVSGLSDVKSKVESSGTLSPEPHINDRQSQKHEQEQEPNQERESCSKATNLPLTTTGQKAGEGSGTQPFRPLQYGEPGWEKSADRPPRKLHIRFKDAVGRRFVFPWEKARTWAGMRRLVRSCFEHVDVIGPHVNAGHYDLIATSIPSSALTDTGSEIGETSNSLPQAPPPPTPAQQDMGIIILPELWEDLVEPGMSILMHMWPMNIPPQPPQLPPAGPHLHPPGVQVVPVFHGRGQGMGRGAGRGTIAPAPPFRPHGWAIVEAPKPRGKTRKRQDGL
ncbi:hypothetical protein F4806DRAFT_465655 [Annulohypoxylon nitens]|nr:hypothetical protein F4806DRAFT_465655 [Annulohypoxylon nitens]